MKKTPIQLSLFHYRIFQWGVFLGVIVVVLVLFLLFEQDRMFTIVSGLLLFLIFLFSIVDVKSQTIIRYSNNKLISFSPRKTKLCEVDFSKTVYYSTYRAKTKLGEEFIVISNQPFNHYVQMHYDDFFYKSYFEATNGFWKDKRNVYDKTKQVRLLFNKSTKPYLPFEKWVEVQTVYPEGRDYPKQ